MMTSAISHVTQAAAKVTGKRYCSDHRGEVAVDAGGYVMRGKTKRWMCFHCQEKKQELGVEKGREG